jgi:hypothetical protein
MEGAMKVKDLEPEEHLCTNCERERHEQYEARTRRQELWMQAKNLLHGDGMDWPEDGRPLPSDYLKLAIFLAGYVAED